eukprot:2475170-Prorocentrum_lima.AAC.1
MPTCSWSTSGGRTGPPGCAPCASAPSRPAAACPPYTTRTACPRPASSPTRAPREVDSQGR